MSSPIIGGLPAFKPDSTLGALEVDILVLSPSEGRSSGHNTAGVHCMVIIFCRSIYTSIVDLPLRLLDLGHTISVCHVIYTLTITDYGAGILRTIEQVWFIRRLYMFSKNIYLAGICAVLALTRFIASMGLTVIAFQRISLPEFGTRFSWLVNRVLTTTAANDVLLAAFLSYCLNRTKDEHIEGSRMSKVLNQLIVIAVESGAITSICAVAVLVCFLTMPLNATYMTLYGILAKCKYFFTLEADSRT
ncbi:hypothetical protein D9758_009402 [Tetrapyrgos nigripes]|uniref:DUF6534 domain-containing protein n=1 Tax=Tetrapyrgos nigripes TaxID=182062 RepID=A0A8H5D3J8_9AGAR|nr:hypothetical protein D9758_009402 [Tetrapyrgos nigripes]